MKSYCLFVDEKRGVRCTRCHLPLAGAAVRECQGNGVSESAAIAAFHTCRNQLGGGRSTLGKCRHLGDPIRNGQLEPITVKVDCNCPCGSIDHPTFACAVAAFGRCLPTYAPADRPKWEGREEAKLYQLCFGCTSFAE
jgi:hypothetical protein